MLETDLYFRLETHTKNESGQVETKTTYYKCGGESQFFAERFGGKYPRQLQMIPDPETYTSIYMTEDRFSQKEPLYMPSFEQADTAMSIAFC